jgi:hypothetical protein
LSIYYSFMPHLRSWAGSSRTTCPSSRWARSMTTTSSPTRTAVRSPHFPSDSSSFRN